MSRYIINALPKHTNLQATVGWDAPMRTFFAQVHDLTKEESENDLVLWIGDNYDEIKSLKGLIEAIAEYAVIPEDILAQLRQDVAVPHTPSALQAGFEELSRRLA